MTMTPSKLRRQGRNAFDPHCDPEDFCPYLPTGWNWIAKRQTWLDGWEEARAKHERDAEGVETIRVGSI